MAGCGENGFSCRVKEHIGTETITHEECVLPAQLNRYRFRVDTDGLKRVFSLRTEQGAELYSLKLDHVYYLCDEGIQMGKWFTGAVFGAAAFGTKQFEYILRSVLIENR